MFLWLLHLVFSSARQPYEYLVLRNHHKAAWLSLECLQAAALRIPPYFRLVSRQEIIRDHNQRISALLE